MKKGKYLLLLLCVPLLVTGCKKVPKLENGQEVVVELGDKKFTAEEFFDALKEGYGSSILVNMVDNYIANKEIEEANVQISNLTKEIEKTDKEIEELKIRTENLLLMYLVYILTMWLLWQVTIALV